MSKRPCTSKQAGEQDEDEETLLEECAEKLPDEENDNYNESFQRHGEMQQDPAFINNMDHFLQQRNVDSQMSMKDIFSRKRPRPADMAGYIDHSQPRYYDRYKQQDYTRRNDFMKYCHVCRKKTVGKLRVLPGDLRMRKVWILRSNLDEERSAELWLRELACEGSHGGEFCEAHFAPGSRELKGNQLIPLDVRPTEGRHSILEDIQFDFDSIILQCVFCGRDGALSSMLPFIRNRSKRSRWIDQLSGGNQEVKRRLTQSLRGGVTQFLCDYHVADCSFEINGFGEWRLLRNALPDPRLTASDKRGVRVYLVDKCRDELFWEREMWKSADTFSQIVTEGEDECPVNEQLIIEDGEMTHFIDDTVQECTGEDGELILVPSSELLSCKQEGSKNSTLDNNQPGTSMKIVKSIPDEDEIEYSDDSDEENELIEKMGNVPYSKRLCQVCSAIEPIGNDFVVDFSYKFNIRTWPFDEFRHKKWLEIMDWPPEFEESMKTLWQKRKNEESLQDAYHFCPINVCQSHLNFRNLPERMRQWHQTFCVLCDSCMSEKNLLVPLPPDQETRQKWVESLFPFDETSKFHFKKVLWLRRRLLRPKPTKYRICVYHFSRDAFVTNEEGKMVLDKDAVPLPMDTDDFDVTPRGPNSVCKCLLCDDWKKMEEMVNLRSPNSEAEKLFLIDTLCQTEKIIVKKALSTLAKVDRTALICASHFPDNMDPFSIIAERRIMFGVQTECVLCAHANDCTTMIPFPGMDDEKLRTKWVNSMCREPWIFRYLSTRLDKRGRHYLCSSHFNRNSLRYHQGLGLWRKASATPVLACTTEEERQEVWDLSKLQPMYHPLILEAFDMDGCGPLDYDDVYTFLGPVRMEEIENELNFHGRNDSLLYRGVRNDRKKQQQQHQTQLQSHEMYEDMPQIYEQEQLHEVDVEDVEVEEIVQEDCIIYEDVHQLEEVVEEVIEEVVDESLTISH